jgi:hypothetical protein
MHDDYDDEGLKATFRHCFCHFQQFEFMANIRRL